MYIVLPHFLQNLHYIQSTTDVKKLQTSLNLSLARALHVHGDHTALPAETGVPPLTLIQYTHHKTLIEMWITCLDPVSANSEKGRGSEWAVRVGQRFPSRFGQSGAARELSLVQIVVEASAIRGGFLNTKPSEPVSGWRCRRVLGDYREGLAI